MDGLLLFTIYKELLSVKITGITYLNVEEHARTAGLQVKLVHDKDYSLENSLKLLCGNLRITFLKKSNSVKFNISGLLQLLNY